ncbi:SDR family NAD(P)-dependent oxidoreductase [Castellaniella defragrans]|jgi:NAD(P)-dependent dehydrogenase (short-subunit alcohol dehydrogenase family)|uniref:NAD(P)-dependent dehydrogenase (Short-subunit alcohol dehydrogenase family) n=2 Tax=Castellaniella defragrans TaxID=75697 RepID=A0A7W9TKF2_CASDE|nr:SDR family oxidoreductase [Castellaniella defragrans]KAB0610266.1 SDR family oxidoreductase [Castellaniella defragrans]MBB6082359.1 NAD(P)-dependent dehydrogenase (short-subunit alcohol dehydrogenase family) [Castellaniella defragrans]CDM24781.1 probable short-chain dehydrogenase [Castellaniella defragrans 65Phen]
MNDRHPDDRRPNTLLITGAGRGIGAATALAAARLGHDIVLNYARDEQAARAVAESIRAMGRRAAVIQADVGRSEDVRRMFAAIDAEAGPLLGLVNNAGITGPIGPFMDTTEATIERVFRVNVLGAMQCAREALTHFRRHGTRGVIVNVSSVAARTGSPGEYVHYAASKAALEAFTLGLAREAAAEGIRVCGVAPGSTLTDIHAAAGEPDRPARVAPRIPLGRLAEPAEIAAAIVWLASPAASYVTGTTLACAGGL